MKASVVGVVVVGRVDKGGAASVVGVVGNPARGRARCGLCVPGSTAPADRRGLTWPGGKKRPDTVVGRLPRWYTYHAYYDTDQYTRLLTPHSLQEEPA